MSKLNHQGSSIGDQAVSDFLECILQSSDQYSIIGLEADGTVQLWNQGARLLYGYEPDEVIGHANLAILHTRGDVVSGRVAEMLRAARENGHWRGEVLRRRKNGTIFTESIALTARHDREQRHVGYLLMSRDISDERKVRGVLESLPDAMVVVNPKGSMVLVNIRLEKLFGYDREELLGKPIERLVPDRFRGRLPQQLNRVFSQRGIRELGAGIESWGLRKGGAEFPVEITLSPVETDNGLLVSAAIRDMTGRRAEERRFRMLVESAPDAMVIVNQTGEIVIVNSQTEKLFGYERTELLGKSIETLVPVSTGPDPEQKGLRKNGTEFPVEISLSPLDTSDGTLLSNSIRDITDRRQLELALLEKNIELERANLAKDTFLANMSHELRTPLNAIIGFTGTLLMQLAGPLTPDQEKQLRTVQRSGRHLLSLINDLLDLAKIESGKVELLLEPVNCVDILNEVVSAETQMAEAKGVALAFEAPVSPVIVRTDARALHQIVLNLTNNAIKFTEQGTIMLGLSEISVGGKAMVEFSVKDTGAGIRPEDQDKLFQAFSQLNSDRRFKGTGLGLHLCQKLTELLHGSITFESEFGQGSTFRLTLHPE